MKRKLADIKYRIRAADHDEDEIEELEIFIFDEISSFFGVSAEKVSELLATHADVKTVTVHINSPGGNALDGVAIYNALQRHSATIEVIVEGMALSAASLIAMAGDTIKMAAGSQMMIHEARGMAHGTAAEVAKFSDLLRATSDQMAAIYSARSGRDLATVKREMKAETFMTADEAVEMGFADEVLEAKALAAHFDLSEFVNDKDRIPAALIELASDSGVRLDAIVLPLRQENKDSPPLGGDNGAVVAPTPIAVMAGVRSVSLVSDFGKRKIK